jgi:hypothetical protein
MRRGFWFPTILLLAAGSLTPWRIAAAQSPCSGEFSSSALQPLPSPAVVALDLPDSTPASSALAGAFTSGMSNAGAAVQGAATVKLRLSWRIIGQGGATGQGGGGNPQVAMQPGSADTGASLWSGNSQTFLEGGIDRAMPGMPQYDVLSPARAVHAGLLTRRAAARDAAGDTIYWIGSVQCTLQGSDNQQLAYQLGQVIGGALGQRRSRVSM